MDMKSLPEACRYVPIKSQWPDYLKKVRYFHVRTPDGS